MSMHLHRRSLIVRLASAALPQVLAWHALLPEGAGHRSCTDGAPLGPAAVLAISMRPL